MKKRGQVWIETVMYTLIALIIIGLVLAYAKPKIEEAQDKATIEKSLVMMQEIDSLVTQLVQGGPGNIRNIGLEIKKGSLVIDEDKEWLLFELDGKYVFSEAKKDKIDFVHVGYGSFFVITEDKGKIKKVTIKRNYTNYDIEYTGTTLQKSSTPYTLSMSNEGKPSPPMSGEKCAKNEDCIDYSSGVCESGTCKYTPTIIKFEVS